MENNREEEGKEGEEVKNQENQKKAKEDARDPKKDSTDDDQKNVEDNLLISLDNLSIQKTKDVKEMTLGFLNNPSQHSSLHRLSKLIGNNGNQEYRDGKIVFTPNNNVKDEITKILVDKSVRQDFFRGITESNKDGDEYANFKGYISKYHKVENVCTKSTEKKSPAIR